MPPLITREEALELGQIEDHEEIEALVERAWQARAGALRRLHRPVLAGQRQVRRLRGGLRLLRPVALRRGRDADARDDGARADARARPRGRGGGRAPLLHGHPGPGPVQARLREGAGRARGWWPSTPTSSAARRSGTCRPQRAQAAARGRHPARAPQRRDGRSPTTPRSPPRSATRAACARSRRSREAGLETCVGGILNLGETREQRVEMAFELAAIDPTSVPINLLNPRPGTKFGDREHMDPWEAVKWIAIFRLILPDALFRAVRRAGGEPRRAAAAGGQGRAQRRDDGQLPHHAGQRARGGPRDVRGAGAQRRPPARQRRATRGPTTARLAGRRHPRRRGGVPRRRPRRRARYR